MLIDSVDCNGANVVGIAVGVAVVIVTTVAGCPDKNVAQAVAA